MTEPTRATEYTWRGVWDEGAGGWQEWFGDPVEYGGLPPRDLTADDTAALNEAQWAHLLSPAGQRLYTAKGAPSGGKKAKGATDGDAGPQDG